jgi:hypothetical protein
VSMLTKKYPLQNSCSKLTENICLNLFLLLTRKGSAPSLRSPSYMLSSKLGGLDHRIAAMTPS